MVITLPALVGEVSRFRTEILTAGERALAARDLGIAYPRVEHHGNDPFGFVVAKNLKRRHLSEAQRAMVAAKIANLRVGDNQHSRLQLGRMCPTSIKPEAAPLTVAGAAAMLKVSERSVKAARKVREDGAPELVQAVERSSCG